jgi:hypothetical protein
MYFITVRLVLSIPVTEIFNVKDELTGNLIQGSEQATDNTHEVVVETMINPAQDLTFEDLEWTICDIDGWLERNEFWNYYPEN